MTMAPSWDTTTSPSFMVLMMLFKYRLMVFVSILTSYVTSKDLGVGVAIGIGIEFYQFVPDSDTDTDPDTDGNKAKSFFLDQPGVLSASGGALE